MKKKLIISIVIFALLIVTGITVYKVYFTQKDNSITATGTIEVTRADIRPKINGYTSELTIKEGDIVTAGQIVTRISRPDLTAQLLENEAALLKAKVQLNDLERGSRSQEIQSASANNASAQAVFVKCEADLERYSQLYKDGAISAQQLDAAQSSYNVASNAMVATEAQQSLITEGNRSDVIEAQRLEVKKLESTVSASQSFLNDTVITSPINGIVLTKNYENGEYLNSGTAIATIGDLNDCWVKIYIPSNQLGLITLDQSAEVRIDGYPDQVFTGTIKEISQNAEFTPRQSITKHERANLVFYVKVKIDNSEGILKPGMPADVVI
jgi:HlyD family secretion protein